MRPDEISDALNQLDEDIIEETNEIRQNPRGRNSFLLRTHSINSGVAAVFTIVLLLTAALLFRPMIYRNAGIGDGSAGEGIAGSDNIIYEGTPENTAPDTNTTPQTAESDLTTLFKKYPDLQEIQTQETKLLRMAGLTNVFNIDYTKAYCVFVDIQLFKHESLSEEQLAKLTDKASVVWCIPLYYTDETHYLEISRSSIDGEWIMARHRIYEGYRDIKYELETILAQNQLVEDYSYIFLGGVPQMRLLLGAVIENGELTKMVSFETDIVNENGIKPEILKQNELYDYEQFRQITLDATK